ncbi:type I polyketide synthase [Actinoplanes couchii]|uniref:type I polyketide synthase n=1 Tax=Actinoplanes couchii TaxID=403638 RepID=UPI0019429438|nr:type I polyketide synthase [Actinoplanes couchii]MDR6320369.1 acyl transferase domain-containing protein/NAD(P)H-dependent flavin oxidoreductase YrpB (nitropropane dioxygenase family)/NADP-dependent 3-hydroxy acid dehydrogenase YdfG/acyl carrier protein [Actinoplanes couchii]
MIGLCPTGEPNPRLVAAVARGGGLGVLDPGTGRKALDDTARLVPDGFAIRVAAPLPADLPNAVRAVIVDAPDGLPDTDLPVLVQVVSLAEARDAVAAGAAGLLARGNEAGGRVGPLTAFVLLQTLLAELPDTPVWAAGGIGPHTAAAAVAGGAAGVVLDGQFALVSELNLPYRAASAIRAMDGSETTVTDGRRVYHHPAHTHPMPPLGAEAAFARPLADRHRSAAAVVRAVREAALAGVAAPAELNLIVQGPMTRVSDQAAFAAAVAAEDGLPFLALALMDGDRTARLLESAADTLGDRPWGVGLLGFSPPEVRSAQLAAVLATRPPYAIIAGGRPDQAAPLDAAGIITFLHVPSPGLLDRFLAQGARRFVFEGSECGGHVGPRASFPLWQSQIDRLLAFDEDLGDVRVLFAGGIHDERSAAMVAALAAPLAARGATVGVLMGTAYLFTAEAVSAGAIVPRFQQVAVETAETVLLETSPGHATRCARTGYVQTFALARQRLAETGTGVQEAWAELERLNLGRLRVASKGLRHQDGALHEVGDDIQHRDGMYMIGDVATLRSTTTTIRELHRQVTSGATDLLVRRARALAPAPAVVREPEPLDIAIVGMACVLPQAGDVTRYWHNTVTGVDAISEIPAGRWDVGRYFDPGAYRRPRRDATPSKWGGFLPRVNFDPLAYGIPPTSLASIEPVQLLALEVAARALADAGYADRPFARDRASVIFGAEAGHDLATAYGFRALLPGYLGDLPPALDEHLPRVTEDSFPGVLSNVISGRIANRLDLGGVNYTVDAACAASLAALDLACKELTTGTSDLVLCGAADLHNGIYDYLMFASVRALSPSGRCATFGAGADGIALGEGVACVTLKRLADAERDGDRVYAVIKSVAGSSDGRSLGLTAPRPEGQRLAVQRAYTAAGVSMADVGMVEAHGTGTVVGDRTELAVLTEAFTEAGAGVGSTALGSVKSQVGHTKCAAGLAGLIKTALAVHTGVHPPTLHVEKPNPYWDGEKSPFTFDRTARPWFRPPAERIAGVSAFGFGGTNFHAVLTGYDEPSHGLDEWPAELFLFRGADRGAATRHLDRLTDLITANDRAGRPWRLRDLAWTVSAGVDPTLPVQTAIVATDLDTLAAALPSARTFTHAPHLGVYAAAPPTPSSATPPMPSSAAVPASPFAAPASPSAVPVPSSAGDPGRIAFLFPGQGSQRPGMLADLFVAFPALRATITGPAARYADVMFPPAAFDQAGDKAQRTALADTRVAQPALGIADLAAFQLLTSLGVRPDQLAGHSYGEVVALTAAGALDPADLVDLSRARAEAILGATTDDPGAMAAVSASAETVRKVLAAHPDVVPANHNAPEQTVISGPTEAIEAAVKALREKRLSAKQLPVACAFHSPVVAAGAVTFLATLAERTVTTPDTEVWSNAEATPYPTQPTRIRSLLARQIADPVRFKDQIEAMYESGTRTFVEVGPGDVLTRLVTATLGDRNHKAVAMDRPGDPGLPRLLKVLAELAVTGVPVDPENLFTGRDTKVVTTTKIPPRPGWTVDGHMVRTTDGNPLPGGLRPAQVLATTEPIPSPHPAAPTSTSSTTPAAPGSRSFATPAAPTSPSFSASPSSTISSSPFTAPSTSGLPSAPPSSSVPSLIPSSASERDAAVMEFLRGTRELVATQREVMLGYLGTSVPLPSNFATPVHPVPADLPIPADLPVPAALPVPADLPVSEGDSQTSVTPSPAPTSVDVLALVVATVSERTGYPPEMLDPALDLEADLSVDSIKRTELIGELADRLGFGGAGGQIDESVVEELTRIKTIRGIADWIEKRSAAISAPTLPPTSPAALSTDSPFSLSTGSPAVEPEPTVDVLSLVVGTVSERTGYPSEMLDPALDLEADLSVDSIKRTELIGELADRLGFGGAGGQIDESVVEELARIKTIRGIADWIQSRTDPGPVSPVAATVVAAPASASASVSVPVPAPPPDLVFASAPAAALTVTPFPFVELPQSLQRYVVQVQEIAHLEPAGPDVSVGSGVAIVADGRGIGLELADMLEEHSIPVSVQDNSASAHGMMASTLDSGGSATGLDGLVYLAGIGPEPAPGVPEVFGVLRRALIGGVRRVIVVTGSAGTFGHGWSGDPATDPTSGAGIRGLVRTIAREYPDVLVRAVDVDLKEAPRKIAGHLLDELAAITTPAADPTAPSVSGPITPAIDPTAPSVSGPTTTSASGPSATAGTSLTASSVSGPTAPSASGPAATAGTGLIAISASGHAVTSVSGPASMSATRTGIIGAGPAAGSGGPVVVGYTNGTRTTLRVSGGSLGGAVDVGAACRDAGIGRESVVLLTGGARGITASVAGVLAGVAGCHLELVGRTPLGVEDLDPEVMAADSEPALRRLLVARGLRNPAEIGAAARRLAAEREIRLTLQRLAGRAASVRYTPVDVRDPQAVALLMTDVHRRHGRLDTIVHGAGLCEDKLLAEKTPESFDRVFGTKVDGARAIAAAAPPYLRQLILFGSVSGVFGNRGQCDYSAANDALDTLARSWHGRVAERVLSVDWGPWAPEAGGMVTPELAREYTRRGVDLIDPAHGVAALLAELAWGRPDQCQVGFLAGPVDNFDGFR